ncbi:transposase-like protein [Saccharomonospora amisosensis]|uniref:Mutator family transposase n=1 Tax=Saccharomonospora amisosensis TaxID=1128677 RepID=A0A7X5UKR4_9PSEU|nr:transposase-like protein [Saccharomonospora amisosensis]
MFIDALVVKVRDGQVANRPIYVAVGITLAGERDVLGMWVGTGGEGAKGWMNHLPDLKNRGVEDILIVACDGLKGLPDAITALWPRAEVQLCGPPGPGEPAVRVEKVLVGDQETTQAHLHRTQPGGSGSGIH